MKCKFYDECGAVFCPLVTNNKNAVWLSSDPICHRQFISDSSVLVLNQKLLKKHNVPGYFTLEMLLSKKLSLPVNGINPDVDDAHSMKIYKHREREWMRSVSMVDKGVKFADLEPQKTLDVYLYPKGKNMHKSAEIEVEK